MSFYLQMILTGLATLALTFWLLKMESARRHFHYVQRFHTRFVVLDTGDAKKLYRTHYIIGRRKRRCDICLDELGDKSISRVHAVLWYDGSDFCIAPARDLSIFRHSGVQEKTLPAVYVNGELVPEEGVVVRCGDSIRMGESHFQLENTL